MKRISIFILTLLISTTIFGCSKVDVEKAPVLIEDTTKDTEDVGTEDLGTVTPEVIESETTKTTKDETIEGTGSESTEDSGDEATDDFGTGVTENNGAGETENNGSGTNDGTNANSNTNSSTDKSESVKLTISIEGMEETIDGKLLVSDLGYNMIYDSERFTYTNEDGIDSFMATNPDPEIYPYVYLNINRIDNTTLSDYVKQLEGSLSTGYKSVNRYNDVKVSGIYNAVQFRAITGDEWNSSVRNYYLIESGSSIYLIEMQYFMEAAEGFGSRMDAILNTFTIN